MLKLQGKSSFHLKAYFKVKTALPKLGVFYRISVNLNKWRKMVKEVQIFLAIVHYFAIFFSKNNHEIERVILHTINPVKSTKWLTTFSWIFHFSLKDFSKKIFANVFHKCQMPLEYAELCARSKRKKTYWGDS